MERNQQVGLLEEYRLSQEYVLSTHERIWQIGGVLVAASLGSFAIVAAQQPITITTLVVSVIAGLVSTSLMIVWFLIRERFASFIQVSYYRMREIETELDLWRNRYIEYLDNPAHFPTTGLTNPELERLKTLDQVFKRRNYTRRRARTLELMLVILVGFTWLMWVIYIGFVLA